MGYSMRLELVRVGSLNSFQLFNVFFYVGHSYLFLSVFFLAYFTHLLLLIFDTFCVCVSVCVCVCVCVLEWFWISLIIIFSLCMWECVSWEFFLCVYAYTYLCMFVSICVCVYDSCIIQLWFKFINKFLFQRVVVRLIYWHYLKFTQTTIV